MVHLFLLPWDWGSVGFFHAKRKNNRKCFCNCEQNTDIDSVGQGLSAATFQFTNCRLLLTCMSVCVCVRELTLVFFWREYQCARLAAVCYRSTVILIRKESRFPGQASLWECSYLTDWSVAYCYSEKVLLSWKSVFTSDTEHAAFKWTPSKEPHRTPAWLSHIVTHGSVVALTKQHFIFGVRDGRQKIEDTVLFISIYFCVFCLLSIYCSVNVLLFWKSSQVDQRVSTLYRLWTTRMKKQNGFTIKLVLYRVRAIHELGGYLFWTEGTWTLSYAHICRNYNATFVIVSLQHSKMFKWKKNKHIHGCTIHHACCSSWISLQHCC